MRTVVTIAVLVATAALPGCGETPTDPYSNMRMLSPEEVGATARVVDPVEQAERAHNAEFAQAKKTAR